MKPLHFKSGGDILSIEVDRQSGAHELDKKRNRSYLPSC